MADWKHELSREQYELVIDSLLRAVAIAAVIEEAADHIDVAALKEMIAALRGRLLETLQLGAFDEGDIAEINREVVASMLQRPDA